MSVTMISRNCSVERFCMLILKSVANDVPPEEPVYVELQSMLQWQGELRYWYAQAIWMDGWFVARLGHC